MNQQQKCPAITNAGKPCPNWSAQEDRELKRFHEFCHVHEPSLWRPSKKRNGQPCTMVTGGVLCRYHVDGVRPSRPRRQERRPRYSPEERRARRAERERLAAMEEQRIAAELRGLDVLAGRTTGN